MDWHYIDAEKEQVGPVPEKAMKALVGSGAVGPDTRVWRSGMSDWVEAGKTELAHLFGADKSLGSEPAVTRRDAPDEEPLALVLLDESGEKIVDLVLKDTPLLIGSSEECDIAVADESLSPRHAYIYRYKGAVYLEDQGSSKGSFVNSVHVEKMAPLNSGDRLKFGDWEITVRFGEQPDEQEQEQAKPILDGSGSANSGIRHCGMSRRTICGWAVSAACFGFLGIVVVARNFGCDAGNDADEQERGQISSSAGGSEDRSSLSVSSVERFLNGYGDAWCEASQELLRNGDEPRPAFGNITINSFCHRNAIVDLFGPPCCITDFEVLSVDEMESDAQNGNVRHQTFSFSMRVTVMSTAGSPMGARRVRGELTWRPRSGSDVKGNLRFL